MSLKNTKNLMIIGAVVVALLAGTVLLGNYTNILSSGSQSKTCQEKTSACCAAAKTCTVEKAECGSVAKTCPLDPTKPCCAVEGTCPKTECPPDCTKPCCAIENAPACCPKSDVSAASAGCCPVTNAVTE